MGVISRLNRLEASKPPPRGKAPPGAPDAPHLGGLYPQYRNDPVGFCRDVLGVELTPDQQAIIQALPGRVKVNAGHNVGKAENVDTVIDTPDGRRYFGDLRPGDRVFGADGSPIRITAVHPQGVIKQYRVTFDDGSYVLCSGEHLWNVQGRQERRPGSKQFGRWLTLTTEEIRRRGLHRSNGENKAAVWTIPRQGAVRYEPRLTGVDPYTMGYWLGNGTVGTGYVTRGGDPEITDWLVSPTSQGIREYPDPDSAAVKVSIPGLKTALDVVGVTNTPTDQKRVPEDYLENTPEFRHALLQGLMDADGTCGKGGACTFTSTSLGLVRDVMWLVRSLGGKASLHPTVKEPWTTEPDGSRKYHKLAYNCTVSHDSLPLFRLKRKQERVKVRERTSQRFITSIEPEGTAEMMCLSVDALDGLYQTRGFVVTHNTMVAACAVLWWFYTRDPCVIITTAPTERDVIDLLWTEIRIRHARAIQPLPDDFPGPRDAQMFDHDEHWAKGYTARRGESFQGRHRPHMLFIFDECEGVDTVYWITTGTMYKPDPVHDHGWLAIGNPTTTSSQSFLEDQMFSADGSPKWNMFVLSALNHPNILAQLAGLPPSVPDAVTVDQIDQAVTDFCTKINLVDRKDGDFEWRPGSGQWWRPGPLFYSRVLGLRPPGGIDTVWSMARFEQVCKPKWRPQDCWTLEFGITIGVDPALFGDDNTAIHVRTGPLSLHHESHNGWEPGHTAGRIKELCSEWADWYNSLALIPTRPKLTGTDVNVNIEFDGGYGVAVYSHRDQYHKWKGVTAGAGSNKFDPTGRKMYLNFRTENWFTSAAKEMDLSRLPKDVLARLRLQLTTPFYIVRPDGSRQVEEKKKIKERLLHSPDDADALIVCHAEPNSWLPSIISPENDDFRVGSNR